ncbi:F-box domain-containing protein [Mycena sanguinolenta]|uniref:F-box domain-containing protein n=1 Tax=Mycena sanguinolenta TaxID=230812 RepID=A0A8H6X8D9_9AGAR|nr:F-box domain-containing protein [Mycena sanguinolenta]
MNNQCSSCGTFWTPVADQVELNLSGPSRTIAHFQELFTTNRPPMDAELSLLQPTAQKTSARLHLLDAEISRLTSRLKELRAEHAVLSAFHVRTRGILSSLRRLPPEIFREIFIQAAPSQRDIVSAVQFPWHVAHVCHSWRLVAFSLSSLWSLISIDFTTQAPYSRARVSAHIQNARSIHVRFIGSEKASRMAQVAAFALVAASAPRWQQLHIRLTSALTKCLSEHAPQLTALRRASVEWDDPSSQHGLSNVDFFRLAVSLVDIDVFSMHMFVPTELPPLASTRLTRCDFDAPLSTHRSLLKSLPNLVEVCIRRAFDDVRNWPQDYEVISLLCARRLYVSHAPMLDYLRAPLLEELAMGGDAPDGPTLRAHIGGLLTRSGCSPTSLSLRGSICEFVSTVLHELVSFTHVALVDSEPEDHFELLSYVLPAASHPDSSNPSPPHVNTLRFSSALHPDVFLRLLESGWSAERSSLKAVELVHHDSGVFSDLSILSRIQALRCVGLSVAIFTGGEAEARESRWLLDNGCN